MSWQWVIVSVIGMLFATVLINEYIKVLQTKADNQGRSIFLRQNIEGIDPEVLEKSIERMKVQQ